MHSTEKAFDKDGWSQNKKVNVLLGRSLELCSHLFQFTNKIDLYCFLKHIITKVQHLWKSELFTVAEKLFECNVKINFQEHTSSQQLYILTNILVRGCTGLSLNIIDGQHRMLYYMYYFLGIKNIEKIDDCFHYSTLEDIINIDKRMASMSSAPATIVNHNWANPFMEIESVISTLKKFSARKQYDIEKTVKTSII